MSVRVSERSQGDLDVIVKAKQMAAHTVEITNNTNYFPKRYRMTITDKIVNKSFEIFMLLYEANEIYPRNKRDFEDRQRNQRRAMACCRTLVAMIDIAKTLFHLPDDKVKYWTRLVVEVRYMTAAWYKKELDRFGKQFADKADAKMEQFITEMELALLEMVKELQG
jgi:uncharacterized Fe-S center protein